MLTNAITGYDKWMLFARGTYDTLVSDVRKYILSYFLNGTCIKLSCIEVSGPVLCGLYICGHLFTVYHGSPWTWSYTIPRESDKIIYTKDKIIPPIGTLVINSSSLRDISCYRLGNRDIPRSMNLSKIKSIIPSDTSLMFLKYDESLTAIGCGYKGQLGLGQTHELWRETTIAKSGVKLVSCGSEHTLIYVKNMRHELVLLGTGSNIEGQLGLERGYNYVSLFKRIRWLTDIIDISCGAKHSAILTKDNKLYVTGNGRDGQLGMTINNLYRFTRSALWYCVKAVSCGLRYTMILTDDGLRVTNKVGNYVKIDIEGKIVTWAIHCMEQCAVILTTKGLYSTTNIQDGLSLIRNKI